MYQNLARKDILNQIPEVEVRSEEWVQCSQGSRPWDTRVDGDRSDTAQGHLGTGSALCPRGCRKDGTLLILESDLGIKKAQGLSTSHTVWLALSFGAKVYMLQETPATVHTMQNPEARRAQWA